MPKIKAIRERILCDFFNYHRWTWNLRRPDGTIEPISNTPPNRAVCERCGAVFGIDYETPNTPTKQ